MGRRVPRIRRKGTLKKVPGSVNYNCSDPTPYTNPLQNYSHYFVAPNKMEVMWDTTGFEDNDFNPCWHEKGLKAGETPWQTEPRKHGAIGPPIMYSWLGGGHSIDQLTACRHIPLDLGEWLDDFSARAEYHFKTAVEPGYSLINFLIEARDLCTFNIETLTQLGKKILAAVRKFREVLAKTGKFWLAWNFAIKPTIQDIREALSVLRKAQKRLKWLKERNHKNTKVKYREGPRFFEGTCIVPHSTPVMGDRIYPGEYDLYPAEADDRPTVELELQYKAEVKLSSWAWVRFDIDDAYLDEVYGLGTVVMAMQGLYNPLAIIWEATPFSWLIDWFRTQRDRIEQLMATDLSVLKDATILATGWALKTEIRAECTWIINRDDPNESRAKAGDILYTLYVRQPGLPTPESSPFLVPHSAYQLSILLALIQQFRRRK